MGWTFYAATHYNNRGIDRKAECDAYFEENLNSGHFKVEKSAMVGNVYYGAVRKLLTCVGKDENGKAVYEPLPAEEQTVFGVVFLTKTDSKAWDNFGYKDMDETVLPGYYDCPDTILDLLSPTDNECALAWRKNCRENNKRKKALKKLPLGTTISVDVYGDTKKYTKSVTGKGTKWVNWDSRRYINPRQILNFGFSVIS